MKFTKTLLVVLIALCAVMATACNAEPKVIDGTVYAEYPKSDILGTVKKDYTLAKIICANESELRLLMLFDTTIVLSSAKIVKGQDVVIKDIPCGQELNELKRLAEIGFQHDTAPKLERK